MALPTFEGEPVAKATVRITRTGDGLSEALKIDPQAFHPGQRLHFVLSGTVQQVNHVQADEDAPLERRHTITTDAIYEIDPDTARKLIAAAAEELERTRAEREGQYAIDDDDQDVD